MQLLDTIILDIVLAVYLFLIVANVFKIYIVIKKVCNTVWLVKLSLSFKLNLYLLLCTVIIYDGLFT